MVVEARFSIAAAYELQGLDLADCQADYAARRAAGQGNGAIVQAWRVAPPPSITTAPWSCIAVPDDAGPAADPAASLDGSDDASWTLPQSAAARSRELLRSQLAALAEQAAQAGDDLSADYYRELLQEAA